MMHALYRCLAHNAPIVDFGGRIAWKVALGATRDRGNEPVVSTLPKLFNQQVIEAVAEINQRPIIFPYSNPHRLLDGCAASTPRIRGELPRTGALARLRAGACWATRDYGLRRMDVSQTARVQCVGM